MPGPEISITPPGVGEVYSPHEVPPGINMSREEWFALSDAQRRLVGNRRFARPAREFDADAT